MGVTGGFAAGKSTLTHLVHEKYGIPVIDVDEAGRRAVAEHETVRAALRKVFGDAFFIDATTLDRKKMAERIFTEDAAREQLNHIVHPVMLQIVFAEMQRIDQETLQSSYLMVNAALLFELDLHKQVDVTVTVWAPFLICAQRAQERDGLSKQQVCSRYQAQWSPAKKAAWSDFVVINSGPWAGLMTQVDELHQKLLLCAQQKNMARSSVAIRGY